VTVLIDSASGEPIGLASSAAVGYANAVLLAGRMAGRRWTETVELAGGTTLTKLEATIEDALRRGDVRALGAALEQVKERRLFAPEFANFARYCSERLGLTRKQVARAGVQLSKPTVLVDGDRVLELSDPQYGELAAARHIAGRLAARFGR
jgi:hypothetical protein